MGIISLTCWTVDFVFKSYMQKHKFKVEISTVVIVKVRYKNTTVTTVQPKQQYLLNPITHSKPVN